MVNVNNYQILLSEEEWNDLDLEIGNNLEEMSFEVSQSKYNLLEMNNGKMSVDHWKNEFNQKMLSISINYGYVYVYFKKLDGYDIYQKKDLEKIAYHYWFSYEVESLLYRLFTLVDNLVHIINVKYQLEIEENLQFRKNVLSALESKNKDLFDCFKDAIKDDRYVTAQDVRNSFTHNHSPLSMTSGFVKQGQTITISKGKYSKPVEILGCIDEFINLLKEITKECNKHL
ncbi:MULTISPECIES: Cthe_2314 family HEPN domain-containing protein [Lysinibacillus]|uniref:Cthe_2314 family HEPN domain-containing protein n=1 Tax=Lysinibacillus capsici TaxID=2115968 RepID=A0ABY8KMC4_9BACI|nr:Cthe_2314 family HEPN domain-containing protein [Lysinibacillus capsici]WGF40265.1 Cthe_2314 family HEPN domain-containing protein [Lysinibacillus capsici]